jgi:hypothetical protein
MITRVRFEKQVADSILTSALDAYPRETILLLRGKAKKDEILLNDILIPPLAVHLPAKDDYCLDAHRVHRTDLNRSGSCVVLSNGVGD